MARPIKKGIDYFPLDVDFLSDIKIRKIMRACGSGSIPILISLLSNIYRDEGYYVAWDEDTAFLVADEVGTSEGSVEELVKKAIQVGFFDKTLFDNENILTSKGIQKRYKIAAYKKTNNAILKKYSLMTTETEFSTSETKKNGVSDDGNGVFDDESTQSKEKKSKVNKTKVNKDSKPRQNKFDEAQLSLANHLLNKILENNPDSRAAKHVDSWANTFRLMMEIDKRTIEQITYLIDWSQQHPFWRTNILSADALRKQYDRLVVLIKTEHEESKNKRQKTSDRKEVLPDWMDNPEVLPPKPQQVHTKSQEELDREVAEMKRKLKEARA
ncbi:DUF4373 domain-containing protein [Listeria booriae]|uniref:DUF4373 domain-containing protein n=1 Tax=Listeria booriae TaxID=1552123 RepID=UPI0016261431|nr:DUF4373 domain-containing protein [Listeria booriae]MBC1525457.1 DUF4373 domain-containing protein [Listeria booriae]